MSEIEDKILAKLRQLDQPAVWSLATVTEDGKPWVRYVTPMAVDDDFVIWGNTFAGARKVAQIGANPEVHLTVGVKDFASAADYLQVSGVAEVVMDSAVKAAKWDAHLSAVYSGPDDPNFAVLKITPYRIEYQTLAPVPPVVWER
jgi:general stress protein 26